MPATSEVTTALRDVEDHHIDVIPDNERHGKVWHQFTLWFGGNVNIFNVVLGGVVVAIGVPFYWAVIAISVGVCLGALLIALHATQGPKLGVPQMIQSRGQFGFYGSSFLFAAVFLLNFGFIAAQLVIQAQAMSLVVSGISIPGWILILVVPSIVIGIYGYKWVHRCQQVTSLLAGAAIVIMFIQAITFGSLPATEQTLHAPPIGLFVAGVALLIIDMLSFGPFVSDYSRYLPRKTSSGRLFAAIYFGNVIATIAACSVGAYIAALLPKLSAVGAVGRISGDWALVIMALSLVGADTFNAYTGSFQILSLATLIKKVKIDRSAAVRIGTFLFAMAVGVVVALLGYKSFVTNLSDFLDVLLVIFIPWSAVNLTDYFLIRRTHYDVASFFRPEGVYGAFAWRGLVAYAVGLGVEFPFVSQTYYTGPLVKDLGGADISWLVGFVVAAALYLLINKLAPDPVNQHLTSAVPFEAEVSPARVAAAGASDR